ncbi:MAG: hypothetical protein FIB04_15115 [Gammaproteobacteria bacterium]|nr:hypothetical protein [Gammaproteobacteria bacterium]
MTSDSASRVTRSSRQLRLAIVLFAAGLAAVTALRAQETSKPAPAPTSAAPNSPATAAAGKNLPAEVKSPPAEDAASPAGATDRKPAAPGSSSAHFEPSEKVRPDFDVSFPVDI